MSASKTAREAFQGLASGGLRGEAQSSWLQFAEAWPEIERWLAVSFRSLRVATKFWEDCGQEVLLRVWRGRMEYRGATAGELCSWIYRICQREHDRLRRGAGRVLGQTTFSVDPDAELCDLGQAPAAEAVAASLERADGGRALAECLRELSAQEASVIELLYSEDEPSEREVAQMVGTSKSRIHVLRQKALASLAYCLRRKGVER